MRGLRRSWEMGLGCEMLNLILLLLRLWQVTLIFEIPNPIAVC